MPVPKHGEVGVKRRDMRRRRERDRKKERHSERRRRGYDSQRRCLLFLCVAPQTIKQA